MAGMGEFWTTSFGRGVAALAVAWLLALPANASEYGEAWGPAIGTEMPAIAANDQTGALRELESLGGERGLLFLIVRSADW